MLSASASNNHSLFSFGRSNGTSATAASSSKHPQPPQHLPPPLPPQIIHTDDDSDDPDDPYLDTEGDLAGLSASYDFLPSVSFDDLQSSLESASTDFKLAQFPSPSGHGSILDAQSAVDKMVEQQSASGPRSAANAAAVAAAATASGTGSTTNNATGNMTATNTRVVGPQSASASTIASSSRISKSGSILRRPSITTRQTMNLSGPTSSATAPDAGVIPASSRQRRQSHYPPVSNSNIGKPPRKSMGPGVLDSEFSSGLGRSASRRRPSLASNSDRPISGSARSSIDGGNRLGSSGGSDATRNLNGSRASKTRSFQQSSRASISVALDPTKASGSGFQRPPRTVSHSSSTGNFNGSASTNSNTLSTKSATFGHSTASKRMSMAPVLHASHATGLGARTVSPTDARRMKRMSIMPPSTNSAMSAGNSISSSTGTGNANGNNNNRDVPQTSNVPLPSSSSSDLRASSRSPSMLPRKTSTPSSSRTTPDPNRKSYSSGFSIGSSMSFNTVRSSTGSIQPRLPQGGAGASSINNTGSRLPAPKPPILHNSTPNIDDSEDVPPVPAIPKVYDSPKESPAELSFFEKRKSNLAYDGSSIHSASTASISGTQPLGLDPPVKIQRKASTRATKDYDKANHTVTGITSMTGKKKNLQPLRLPPMNLQPLSVPTAAKIAALQEQIAATPDRNLSPPPSRIIAKTPTTPMTASKGSFFSRQRNEERAELTLAMRSSSSVHHHHHHHHHHNTLTESGSGGSGGSGGDDDDTSASDFYAAAEQATKTSSLHKPSISPFLSSSAPKGNSMGPASFNTSKTPGDDSDSAYTTPSSFMTPIPPPIPASASASTIRKPSGPRAPAPTPSRAFAPLESVSTIITGDASYLEPMPTSTSTGGQAPRSPPPISSPDEPPTPSSIGSSLRRKLSLSWKRSNSKSSLSIQGGSISDKPADMPASDYKQMPALQQQQDDQRQNTGHRRQISINDKHDGMPPPRVPKSATMNQMPSSKKSQSPTLVAPAAAKTPGTYLDSRRRKSSASSLNAILAHDKKPEPSWANGDRPHAKDASASSTVAASSEVGTAVSHMHTAHSSHTSSVMQKILKTKQSTTSIRHHHDMWTADLDSDDLVAEEEMRKLGARRKDTELAARTLDALRKRATPKERVSHQEAARIAMLNIYERGEIVDYHDIYFCGTQNAAKVAGNPDSDKIPNFGYDDERGDYAIVAGDHLAYRYEIIDLLGKGSFGQVVRCIDHKTGVLVAVKIIRNKKRFHQQALVEVNILQKLREWDPKNKHSMVNFTHSFYFRGHLCISTELLDMNLYEFIKANSFRGSSLKLVRRFTKQMLSSLMLLKQHKVIHCDLKPENVLLRHPLHTELKVIDFGSSCFENERVYTYIQSRFYRSPEVILGMTYGMPIDMWSLGCILAELFTGVPIFPGENEQEQLACIMEVFGPPEKHLIEKSTRKKLFFDSMGKPRLTVSSKGRRRRPSSKTLQQVIKCDDEAFLDFLSRCLRWDPDRRLKPEEAIRHEFITGQKAVVRPPVPRHSLSTRDGSPVRRHHTISVSGTGGPRPLPEPPHSTSGGSNTVKIGAAPTLRAGRESLGVGAHKSINAPTIASARRASAVSASTTSASMSKRTSGTAGMGGSSTSGGTVGGLTSNLPRAAGRVVSGGSLGSSVSKPDLAAAGAAAAMTRRA
ncbi:dual-specificity tyrosine-(Y)-phosphorylation regulated kinase [Sporothrix brasiliensis 5110]|uniref:Dual-specificity tyrosine-(Y)-phosphorylation regulated kinase n=1 Tax=Sporothrix brasiliensis 5110 TaxID=1398154 RepID=A0A0C2EQE6_9PEZI|nr:dual-specificity tyrosine-(Y)-phosphorylation regulated kinase [Sporothrix brasiliensis 5110]KIH88564.1 dual-specificity tyrosine-(Y)-phosphorylation regulated kinase [Sporothrix brasiliensis 5110]